LSFQNYCTYRVI